MFHRIHCLCQTAWFKELLDPILLFPGTVPALEYESGKGIFDSNIINFYLDEKYPEVPLQSTDPLRRAQDKMIVENFAPVSRICSGNVTIRIKKQDKGTICQLSLQMLSHRYFNVFARLRYLISFLSIKIGASGLLMN